MKNKNNKVLSIYAKNTYKVYYAHSMSFYNSAIELKDLKFLNPKYNVVNPKDLKFSGNRSMLPYLLTVKDCDIVYYRGNTIGVVIEVLTSLSLHKPVYSLKSKDLMTYNEIKNFATIFNNNPYHNKDLTLIKSISNSVYNGVLTMLNGDF